MKKGEGWLDGNQRMFFIFNLSHFSPLVAALVLICALSAPVNTPAQTDEENLVSVDASVSPDRVLPGAVALLSIKLNLASGAHANSNKVADPNLIPTVFLPKPQTGLSWGQPKYPKPTQVIEWYSTDPLSVFEDGAVINVPLTIEKAAMPGRLTVEGSLQIQVCDSEKCYPMRRVPVTFSLSIVNKEDAAKPSDSASSAKETNSSNFDPKTNLATDIQAANAGIAVGAQVPEFTFTDFNGKPRKFSEFSGHYVLVDFWATWCKPCLADIPHLKELYAKYHDKGLEIIGMDSETLEQDDEEPDPQFAKERDERAHQIVATRGAVWTHATAATAVPVAMKIFAVKTLPAKILIDAQGKIVARVEGGAELDHLLAKLFGEKQ